MSTTGLRDDVSGLAAEYAVADLPVPAVVLQGGQAVGPSLRLQSALPCDLIL
jgi:hypothetical protein